jgi:anaerobic magnesium-protoporphyrin IX monomethyl ester cyclase
MKKNNNTISISNLNDALEQDIDIISKPIDQNMKILFINPCLRLGSEHKLLPVGLASVMTYIDVHGFDFDLYDIDINDYGDEKVEDFIKNNQYDIIMYGSIVTHYKWIKWLSKIIKQYHPNTTTIVGNSVSGSIPEVFLKNSSADIAIIGEAELTVLEIMQAIYNNNEIYDPSIIKDISGLAYINDDGIVVITEGRKGLKKLDDFPMIRWHYFDVERYILKGSQAALDTGTKDEIRAMPIVTARGCVFRCTFCHFVFVDDPYRYRGPQAIVEELRRDIDLYNINYFFFWDDLTFASLNQVERLMDAILDSGLKFHWTAAVRTDLFGNPKHTYEKRLRLAKKCKEAGCVGMGFSLESGNQEILTMMEKHVELDYFVEQTEILAKAGIISQTSVVFGYPPETKETIRETFDMCSAANVYPSIGFLLPLPKTKMYDYAKEQGFIKNEDEFLDSITERQDICVNLTKLTDDEVMSTILKESKKLQKKLNLKLKGAIKTGGYTKHSNREKQIKRKENDVSFNYSDSEFDFENSNLPVEENNSSVKDVNILTTK